MSDETKKKGNHISRKHLKYIARASDRYQIIQIEEKERERVDAALPHPKLFGYSAASRVIILVDYPTANIPLARFFFFFFFFFLFVFIPPGWQKKKEKHKQPTTPIGFNPRCSSSRALEGESCIIPRHHQKYNLLRSLSLSLRSRTTNSHPDE